MDKKGIAILVVAIAALCIWYPYNQKQMEELGKQRDAWLKYQRELKEQEAKQQTASGQSTGTTEAGSPTASTPGVAPVTNENSPTTVAAPAPAEQTETITTDAGDYVFTSFGGGIRELRLNGHFSENQRPMVMNEFGDPSGKLALGATAESVDSMVEARANYEMSVDRPGRTVTFQRVDATRNVRITKKYTLPEPPDPKRYKDTLREKYVVRLEVTHTNLAQSPTRVAPYHIHVGSAAPLHSADQPIYIGFDYFRDGANKFHDVNWFKGGGFLFFGGGERPVFRESSRNIQWVGVTNQYFASLVTVLPDPALKIEDERAAQRGVGAWAKRFRITDETWRASGRSLSGSHELHGVNAAVQAPGYDLAAAGSVTRAFQIYTGPREYRRLRLLDNSEGGILDFDNLFGNFMFLGNIAGGSSRMLLMMMNFIERWIGSYALAIVILTIIVKSILWPLQNRATKEMKMMALLQPEMKRIQDLYQNEPLKLNEEMRSLYSKYDVNPIRGCLPMLIQFPIFIGFYNMLGKAVELRGSGFLWVHDLAAPDTVAVLLGMPINPLPLLMAGTMFLQMRMTPQAADPMQQKVFMFMPVMFLFICYNFASALALYWTIQNLLSIVQLQITQRQAAPTLADLEKRRKAKKS
jgi:YidC/Oxa1 family membrane protein insertase